MRRKGTTLTTILVCGIGMALGLSPSRPAGVSVAHAQTAPIDVNLVDTDFDTDALGSLPEPFDRLSDACATPVVGVSDDRSASGARSLSYSGCGSSNRVGWTLPLPENEPITHVSVNLRRAVRLSSLANGESYLGVIEDGGGTRDLLKWDDHGGGQRFIELFNGDLVHGYDEYIFDEVEVTYDFVNRSMQVAVNGQTVLSNRPLYPTTMPRLVVGYLQGTTLARTWDDDVVVTVTLAPDGDDDGLADDLESGFGGTDPEASLSITNPETGDAAIGSGSAEDGAYFQSGSFDIALPAGTSVDTGGGADQIEITLDHTLPARVEVSGADLAGGSKAITMPFDGTAQSPAVCIDDSPTASIETILAGGSCGGTLVAIPAIVGNSATSGAFTVTRVNDSPPRVNIAGLSHTALATVALGAPVVVEMVSAVAPVEVGAQVSATASFFDSDGDTSSATFDWGDCATSAGTIAADEGSADGQHTYTSPGVYTVTITLSDDGGNIASETFQYVVVYDPNGGFVTGSGWLDSPAGALMANPTLMGKASFGFVAKYKKGKTLPEGNTEFQFKAGNLNFKSTGDYMWLVVSGSANKATYKGTGKVNNLGNYGFIVSAIDAANTPSTSVDLFRIKIWDKNNGDAVVYDNQLGTSCGTGDDAEACTAIGGGSIQIHKK